MTKRDFAAKDCYTQTGGGYRQKDNQNYQIWHRTPENQTAITFPRLFLQVYINNSLFEIPGNTSSLKYFSQTGYKTSINNQCSR